MPLNLGHISQEVDSLAQTVAGSLPSQQHLLQQAQELLRSVSADALRQKLELHHSQRTRIPWLVATPRGPLASAIPAPSPPRDFCVVGTDASSIAPDRHSSVRYYVINVGYAVLRYGSVPDALLEAQGQLCFRDEDVYIFPETRRVPVEATLLAARMEVHSLRILEQALQGAKGPVIALRDGPLILWTLQNEDGKVQQAVLNDFLGALAYLKDAGVAVAGYISYTDGRDVSNSLRVWLCPNLAADCLRCKSDHHELCTALAEIRDRELFSFLAEGQRSELFSSSSQILEQYGEHRVDFFYFNADGEIARVEVPQWLAADDEMLSLLHAAIYDQCRRSPAFPPYPPALVEAHEQAVITTSERQVVEEMVERALGRLGQVVARSAKEVSKRRRGV